jgi:NADPH:quinone reductase
MRAAVCRGYGPPESIDVVSDAEAASPGPGQVRVRVGAAAVNFPDVLLMANKYQVSVPVPFVPGSEFAGVVDCVGAGVTGLAVGDRVMGTSITGAFAEATVVPAGSVTRIPDGVPDPAAAAFGVAHRTAYHVLRSVACVRAGERLIVLGAGGGVGLAAVQLGVILGATVIAVASSDEKLAVAASYGATVLVNHGGVNHASAGGSRPGLHDAAPDGTPAGVNHASADGFRQALGDAVPGGADVVVDPVGGDLAEPALRTLRYGGRFVTVGYASGTVPKIPLNLVLLKGCRVLGFQFRSFAANQPEEARRDEAELLALLAAGRAAPHIGATFPLAEAAAALRHVADGKAIGKVVLEIG